MPQHSASALFQRLLARGKFRHVQVLLQLAELGSVQRTADAIGLTQSSVTQTLAYLEQLLEVRLFERHARGVRPTPACSDLLPVARQLLLGMADGAQAIAARLNRGQGQVRALGSAAAINGLLLEALPRFGDRHPTIQVQLREAEGEDQLLAIARGEVDLVACRQPAVVPEGWRFGALREDRFAVVGRAAHPLAKLRTPSRAALEQAQWLLLPVGLAARRRFDELAAQFAAPPRVFPVVSSSLALLWHLLRERDLLAMLPLQLARPLLEAGDLVELLTGQESRVAPLGVLHPAAQLAPAAELLLAFLREAVAPAARRQGGVS